MPVQNLPEVGDIVTGFTAMIDYVERVMRDDFVVESVVKQPDGYGHGPYDIYPGGYEVTARKLGDFGAYNPEGEVVSFLMGAGGSAGNNRDIRIVGKMMRTVNFSRA